MNWCFNFHNLRGLAFHEYSLLGRPASPACVRLLERDAMWLYNVASGRPVAFFGPHRIARVAM